MLSTALLSGLAAFTLWHAIARKQPPGLRQLYTALPDPVRGFVGCPWCFGAWIAAAVVIAAIWGTNVDPIDGLVMILAAAAIPGTLDAFTPDDGEVI